MTDHSFDISLDEILNSSGLHNGVRNGSDKKDHAQGLPEENIMKNLVAFGDIDGDGHREAVVPVTWCYASCSRIIYVYKKDKGLIITGFLREAENVSPKYGITSIAIKNGAIVITREQNPYVPNPTNIYQVKFVDGDLRVLDPVTGKYVNTNPK